MDKNNKSSGFTLVEIMIAAGMIAGLSLAVMQISSTGSKSAKKIATDVEITTTIANAAAILRDKASCEKTLESINLSSALAAFPGGVQLPKIFRAMNSGGGPTYNPFLELSTMPNPSVIYSRGTPGAFWIEDMKLSSYVAGNPGTAKVAIKFSKPPGAASQDTMFGATSSVRFIDVMVTDLNANGVFNLGTDFCTVDETSFLDESCTSLGGTFDLPTNTCINLPWVKKAGDVMTGPLTTTALTSTSDITATRNVTAGGTVSATGNISSSANISATGDIVGNRLCTGANCRTIPELALSNQACPAGQVSIGVKADGTQNCKALQCPANQFFAGLDVSNNPVCRPYPTKTCPTNQYVSQVNADGTVICNILPNNALSTCPVGQVIQSINAGIPTCVDKGPGTTCPANQYVSAVAANGAITCSSIAPGRQLYRIVSPGCHAYGALSDSPTCTTYSYTYSIMTSCTKCDAANLQSYNRYYTCVGSQVMGTSRACIENCNKAGCTCKEIAQTTPGLTSPASCANTPL